MIAVARKRRQLEHGEPGDGKYADDEGDHDDDEEDVHCKPPFDPASHLDPAASSGLPLTRDQGLSAGTHARDT
jgi:hypothetical protein